MGSSQCQRLEDLALGGWSTILRVLLVCLTLTSCYHQIVQTWGPCAKGKHLARRAPRPPARKALVQRCTPPRAEHKPLCWWTGSRNPSRSTPSPLDHCGTWNNVISSGILLTVRTHWGKRILILHLYWRFFCQNGFIFLLIKHGTKGSVRIEMLGHFCNHHQRLHANTSARQILCEYIWTNSTTNTKPG